MKGYILIIGAPALVMSGLVTLNIFFQQSLETEIADQFSRQQFLLSSAIADLTGARRRRPRHSA